MSKEKTFSSEEERLEKIRKRKKDRLYKAERRKDPEFRKRQSEIAKKSYQKRKEKILFEMRTKYNNESDYKKKQRDSNKKWYAKNKNEINEKKRIKWKTDPLLRSKSILQMQEWQEKNKSYMIKYRKNTRQRASKYEREKTKNDPIYRIAKNLRARMRDIIKRNLKAGIEITKKTTTQENLGCSFEKFKNYIESKWLPNMNWENYGLNGWHIDHIIPAGVIDLTSKENQKYASIYKNLQPLWAKENLKKNSNIKKIFPLNTNDKDIDNWLTDLKKRLRKDLSFKFNRYSNNDIKVIEIYPIFKLK